MSRFFLNNVHYFITVSTINHQKFFNTNEKKNLILNKINKAKQKYSLGRIDFGINSDHYHLVSYFRQGDLVPRFLNYINGGSSYELNKMEGQVGRKIWDEYHIYYIDNEISLWKIKGYVVGNPYKHQEVSGLENLINYPFSSFKDLVLEIGIKEAEEVVLSVIGMSEEDFKKELKNLSGDDNKTISYPL